MRSAQTGLHYKAISSREPGIPVGTGPAQGAVLGRIGVNKGGCACRVQVQRSGRPKQKLFNSLNSVASFQLARIRDRIVASEYAEVQQ
jgi:hypothetical protein